MENYFEILIPVVLCLVGLCYFWYSSRKKDEVIDEKSEEEQRMKKYAIHKLKDDELESTVLEELIKQGCKQELAEEIVQKAVNELEKNGKKIKLQYLIFGLLFFIGGLFITIWSYTKAEAQGGTYYITWGAILFGGFLLYKWFES